MRDAVLAAQALTQAPRTLVAHSALGWLSLDTQALANIEHPVTRQVPPLSTFTLAVAISGERKSAVDREMNKAIEERERTLKRAYEGALPDCHDAVDVYEAHRRSVLANPQKSREEKLREVHAMDRPDPLRRHTIVVPEPTFEGLVDTLQHGQCSVGVITAEAGEFLGGHGMRDTAKVTMLTGLSRLWDDGSVKRNRKSENADLADLRLTMSLAVQPKLGDALLGDELARDQGFLARFLVCYPESTVGTRKTERIEARNFLADRFHDRIAELLEQHDPASAGCRDIAAITLSEAAYESWRAVAQAVEDQSGVGGMWAPVSSTASKIGENILRIAGQFHLFEGMTPEAPMLEETMSKAIAVGDFYLNEALRLTGGVADNVEDRTLKEVSDAIHHLLARRQGPERWTFAPSTVIGFMPRHSRKAKQLKERLAALQAIGHIELLDGAHIVDGALRREVYRFVPYDAG